MNDRLELYRPIDVHAPAANVTGEMELYGANNNAPAERNRTRLGHDQPADAFFGYLDDLDAAVKAAHDPYRAGGMVGDAVDIAAPSIWDWAGNDAKDSGRYDLR